MLRDFVETSLDADQIGDLLTMAGFELEGIDDVEGDSVLDIKVVSNRGDGLSVFGLAREILAKEPTARPTELYRRGQDGFPRADRDRKLESSSVSVETDDCTRYACRMIEGLSKQDSPEWLQLRLRQAGMRPLGLVVDCSNYVMLEMGQPLHAFDFDTLRGGRIVVRKARDGETLTTLNGTEHKLRTDQMMICDAEGPVAAAGIMGGLATEVTDSTTRMLLESAHFVNTSVRRTRKQMNLSTEASYRFERSVDPNGVVRALDRFVELYIACGGTGVCLDGVVDVVTSEPPGVELAVRMSRVTTLLGMDVSLEEATRYLTGLGFGVEHTSGDCLTVVAPTWRPDILREDDVVEEIGRVHGFDRIPETLPHGATTRGGQPDLETSIDLIRQKLLRAGLSQTISHTLRDQHPLDAAGDRVGPRNPGSPETALLRNSTWPSLAEAAARNGGKNLHLFETGRVFEGSGGVERRSLGILSQGAIYPSDRQHETSPQADFFSVKGIVERIAPGLHFELSSDSRLHPTRQARIDGVGILGVIHPDAAKASDLPADTVLAEFDLDRLAELASTAVHYRPFSRNPAVRRDIAFVVEKSVPFDSIESAIRSACGNILERLWLFDVYEGKGIPDGSHSLAVALQLRKFGENFTDAEANEVRELAVQALERLGASPRV